MHGPPGDHEAGLEKRDRRLVIDRFRMHAADDGDIVHHARRVRQQFGDPRAGFAVLRKFEDRRRDRESGVCPLVMVVRRWPWRIESGRSLSNSSFIFGL